MGIFANDVEELEVKSEVSEVEIGLITRYEISNKYAPYLALYYVTKTFGTANLALATDDHVYGTEGAIKKAGQENKFEARDNADIGNIS